MAAPGADGTVQGSRRPEPARDGPRSPGGSRGEKGGRAAPEAPELCASVAAKGALPGAHVSGAGLAAQPATGNPAAAAPVEGVGTDPESEAVDDTVSHTGRLGADVLTQAGARLACGDYGGCLALLDACKHSRGGPTPADLRRMELICRIHSAGEAQSWWQVRGSERCSGTMYG